MKTEAEIRDLLKIKKQELKWTTTSIAVKFEVETLEWVLSPSISKEEPKQ